MAPPVSAEAAGTGGNVYDKYGSSNPIERRLMAGFLRCLEGLVLETGATRAHEIGCGEGELAIRMTKWGLEVRGTDAFEPALEEARRRAATAKAEIQFEQARVEDLDPARDRAELMVCCEVLEHLPDPEGALDKLAELADPWLIASVPREPLWRGLNLGRLSYVRDLGNTPGHLNHWSKRGFQRFLERRFELVEVLSPAPWTMALCRVQSRAS